MGLRDALRALRKEAEGDYIILVADDGEMRRVPGDAGLRILRAWYAREEGENPHDPLVEKLLNELPTRGWTERNPELDGTLFRLVRMLMESGPE